MSEQRKYGQDYSLHSDFWQDDDSEVQPMPIARRDNFVAPERKPAIAYPMSEPAKTVIVERVFEAMPGADEKTSGMDRSNALIVRMMPPGCASLCFAVAVAMVLIFNGGGAWSIPIALIVLAGCLAYIYNRMDAREYDNSRAGLERHRINTAAALKAQELAQQHELRQAALSQYIKTLEDSDR